MQKKKKEQNTTVLDAVSDAVLGQPEKGLTLGETYARRLSSTVLNGEWWKEQLQIEDGTGKAGATDSWEFRVYFNPDGPGNVQLLKGMNTSQQEAIAAATSQR